MTRVAVVYGTRPEMIKLAPVIKLLGDRAFGVHTGQHFDPFLSDHILEEMSFPSPQVNLGVGGQTRAAQIGNAVLRLEEAVMGSDAVIVQGDTNSGLAGALVANALEIPLFHVEAGLRSYDRRMPEEHNRVLIDHLADVCWAPTDENMANLASEGITGGRAIKTGNPIVEALAAIAPPREDVDEILGNFEVQLRGFILATLHRPENVDDAGRLEQILNHLGRLPLPVLFPIHPRTRARIEAAGIVIPDRLKVVDPVGYREFLGLLGSSRLVVSDSGGVQEEVSILKVPLIVLRRSTERPEVLGTFASLTDSPDEMSSLATDLLGSGDEGLRRLADIPCPYGDGMASMRMARSLEKSIL